jgi:predicted nuclease of predicted toxin-antitoxin system
VRIKFLADENLRRAIVLGVRRREPSASFVEAFEIGAAGKGDIALLRIAAEEGRILVSHDLKTMPRHFHHFIAGQASPGVILIPQTLALSTAIEDLVTISLVSEAEEWVNQILFLPL